MCYVDDFNELQPDLYKRLIGGEREVHDEYYAYRIGGKSDYYVERMDLEMLSLHGWRPDFESARSKEKTQLKTLKLDQYR